MIETKDFIRIIKELPKQTFYFTEEGWSHKQEYEHDFDKFILVYEAKAWAEDGQADAEVLQIHLQYESEKITPNAIQYETLKELIESLCYVEIM